ncbi:hypothetical protein EYZ11_010099 [Aspergillus tanneri]|uniref:U1-C C2H2-type zinc finger domain-containing protein n=1 Tax=Aspergillus tanneri TaxID=1220188 RepID=A0A4S3J682_9EURO|nr:hypothetical protein EYZ11_010099 [Aspergillus tanneri]
MSVRKAHNSGRNHLRNVLEYYQQIGQEKAQSVIDSITSSYAAEGQAVPNPAMAPPGALPPPFGFPDITNHIQVDQANSLRLLFHLECLPQEDQTVLPACLLPQEVEASLFLLHSLQHQVPLPRVTSPYLLFPTCLLQEVKVSLPRQAVSLPTSRHHLQVPPGSPPCLPQASHRRDTTLVLVLGWVDRPDQTDMHPPVLDLEVSLVRLQVWETRVEFKACLVFFKFLPSFGM